MDDLSAELADLLAELERSPHAGASRLRAAVLANRLAALRRDCFAADVAEAVAAAIEPGATPALRSALAEQAHLAAQLRRNMSSGGGVVATSERGQRERLTDDRNAGERESKPRLSGASA